MQSSRPEQQQNRIRVRTFIVFIVFLALYFVLGLRVVILQVVQNHYFNHEASLYRDKLRVLPAQRGLILDRNEQLLAVNEPGIAVWADPQEVTDPTAAAEQLSPVLGMPVDRLIKLLTPRTPRSHYATLARQRPKDLESAVTALNIPGIHITQDTVRAYPDRDLASQVIGFTNRDGIGAEGIEKSQEDLLRGVDGSERAEVDQHGRILPETTIKREEPKNGSDITLTIDKTLQYEADVALNKAITTHHAKRGVCIVLDTTTGEILALSNAPGNDLSAPHVSTPVAAGQPDPFESRQRDSAVSDLYEPGSTLKTVTAGALLQTFGSSKLHEVVYCKGIIHIGKYAVRCAKDPPMYGIHGRETLTEVMQNSCNIGMAHFGKEVGPGVLYEYEQKFGFMDKLNTGLPGEQITHLLSPFEKNRHTGGIGWPAIQLANISFGQGISVTPLHLAAAYACVANGGVLMEPHIIKSIRTNGVTVDVAPKEIRRVLSPEVAAEVRGLLGAVVRKGTGQSAQIAGYSVGGKTGSAQMAGPHGYIGGEYVASFIGMVPLSKPRIVILCAVFQPQGIHWGAAVAAPVVHDLAKDAMLQMHIEPDAPELLDWNDPRRKHLKKGALAPTPAVANEIKEY